MAKAKTKTKAKQANKARAPKAKAKRKAKSKHANAKAKTRSAPANKAKQAKKAQAKAKPAVKPAKARPAVLPAEAEDEATQAAVVANTPQDGEGAGMAPFAITETSPGNYSLLLTRFEPASDVFDAAGIEGGGYAWEGVARHVGDVIAPEIAGKFGLDPEASMFCAYGDDLVVLERLGAELAKLFHDANALGKVIETVGRDGFDD